MLCGDPPFYSDGLVGTYGKIIDYKNSLRFETNINQHAEDLIRKFLADMNVRYGKNGIAEICAHPFFGTDEWTWDNIRQTLAPYTVELKEWLKIMFELTSFFIKLSSSFAAKI